MGKYNKNDIVTGIVTGIERYGIFVQLDNFYSGLIHISEISDDFVRNTNNYVTIGEKIKAKVIETCDNSGQVKLSIKNLDYHLVNVEDAKIEETGSGFKVLKDNLQGWIDDYKKEK